MGLGSTASSDGDTLVRWLTRRWFAFAIGLVCLANLAVVWSADWLPLQDWGGHLQHLDIVARQSDPATVYPELFQVHSLFGANGLELMLARVLGPLFGAMFVLKLVLAFYLVATPLSLVAVAQAFGRPRWVALLGAPLVFNGAFGFGFMPFLAGIPLSFFALALARRYATTGRFRTGVALTVLLTLAFFAHAIAWLIAVSFVLATLVLFVPQRRHWRRFLPLPLSSPFVVAWVVDRVATNTSAPPGLAFLGPGGLDLQSRPLQQAIDAIPNWGLHFQAGSADGVATIAIMFVWLMMMAVASVTAPPAVAGPTDSGWRFRVRPFALELATLGCLVGYFVLPENIPPAGIIRERWLVFAILLLPLWIRAPASRGTAWAPLIAFALACSYPLTIADTARKYEREVVGRLPEAIAALPDRSALLYLVRGPPAPHTFLSPHLLHPTGLHALLNGGHANLTFVGLPYTATDFQPGKVPSYVLHPLSPYALPDLKEWDAVLVWSLVEPVDAGQSRDLISTWHEGPWWLYEVVKPPFAGISMSGGISGATAILACPPNELLVGVDLEKERISTAIRSVRAVCGSLSSDPLTMGSFGPAHAGAWRGGGGRVDAALRCPEREWVDGLQGRADRYLRSLRIHCSGGSTIGAVGDLEGTPFKLGCGAGRAALGIKVRFGTMIDAIGLACE